MVAGASRCAIYRGGIDCAPVGRFRYFLGALSKPLSRLPAKRLPFRFRVLA